MQIAGLGATITGSVGLRLYPNLGAKHIANASFLDDCEGSPHTQTFAKVASAPSARFTGLASGFKFPEYGQGDLVGLFTMRPNDVNISRSDNSILSSTVIVA